MNIFSEDGVADGIQELVKTLGWEEGDDVVVEVGGTAVSGIHQGENYNEKWATPYGVRKYNKDAFIVVKNLSRTPFEPSKPNPELKARHAES